MINNTLSLVRINATAVLEVVSSALPHNIINIYAGVNSYVLPNGGTNRRQQFPVLRRLAHSRVTEP